MTPTVVGCVSSMATFVTYVLHSYCSASILFVKHNVVMDTRRPHAMRGLRDWKRMRNGNMNWTTRVWLVHKTALQVSSL
jgi:predicted small integral membrane protein